MEDRVLVGPGMSAVLPKDRLILNYARDYEDFLPEPPLLVFAYVCRDWVYSDTGECGYEIVDLPETVSDLRTTSSVEKGLGKTTIVEREDSLPTTTVVWTTSYLLTYLRATETNLRMRKATLDELQELNSCLM
jgi:hypothetical protein